MITDELRHEINPAIVSKGKYIRTWTGVRNAYGALPDARYAFRNAIQEKRNAETLDVRH